MGLVISFVADILEWDATICKSSAALVIASAFGVSSAAHDALLQLRIDAHDIWIKHNEKHEIAAAVSDERQF